MMTNDDIKLIGEEMERVLQPVYEDLDGLKNDVGELKVDVKSLKKEVKELREDTDGLTGEMFSVQQKLDIIQDVVTTIKEQNRSEHDEIRKHVGMPAFKAA